jgi:nitrogen-specific signal transduction histidine kinase
MIPESRLFCSLDGLSAGVRAKTRSSILQDLGLLEAETVPVFEEVVQTAAHFTGMAMAMLTVINGDRELLKATFGLIHLGLMNELVRHRFIELQDSFATHVVDSHQALVITDTHAHPAFAQSLLTQQYGIRSYIGVPLVTSNGACVGVLSVLDTEMREFNLREIEFLMMTARFAMSDCERLHSVKLTPRSAIVPLSQPQSGSQTIAPRIDDSETIPLKFKLLAHLTQELRTPLTSVMGMASVLNREIYGPLTAKQREYLGIIHNSGDYLLSLVKEILELSQLNLQSQELNLTSVDIEMLCQQAIATLQQAAQRREQEIRLTVEPGNRIWSLDKEKMRQMLYHLIFSVIQSSNGGSVVHLHAANKVSGLRLTLWVTHPCLEYISYGSSLNEYEVRLDRLPTDSSRSTGVLNSPPSTPEIEIPERLHFNLGFLLSRQLVGLHGGEIQVQAHATGGDRYVVTVPRLSC